ncbi:thioredoxin family protein [Paremcibacter congregatus]|uniref:Thiol reductase thioredoxin n=1 Tax=Paremcibacter congregatus TaxID=2043170 RepID=A0A2G4YPB7_9PROT|nr:thioredoxin family protein [Paremcibacter congregatus]PHZ84164.1 thiol reductase thioredoxin [Paremcibacter congregatus]QDE25776.1 thioredoxin family protein [Paremcibacter congregatus]
MRDVVRFCVVVGLLLAGVGGAWAFGGPSEEELVGVITPQELQVAPYQAWYSRQTADYDVDKITAGDLQALMTGVEVTIVMGTWCHDSQRQVPRFYKVLQTAGISLNRVRMLAVDQDFTTPDKAEKGLGITNTPTFIFSQDGVEINRIVESPVESLEKDMRAILTRASYRHSKMDDVED